MGLHTEKEQKRYLTVLADSKFHERVDEDTEGATIRTKKEQDGTVSDVLDKEGDQIWEIKHSGITAKITKIQLRGGDYGTSLNIDMTDEDDNQFVVSLKCDSSYGERFMEALPNLDLSEDVEFKPFGFKPKGSDQKIRGLNILQDGEKVLSAFAVRDEDGDYEVLVEGFPMPDPKKTYKSESWKIFFGVRREWVLDYLIEAEMLLAADASVAEKKEDEEEPDEEAVEEAVVAKKVKGVAQMGVAQKTVAKKTGKKGDKDDF